MKFSVRNLKMGEATKNSNNKPAKNKKESSGSVIKIAALGLVGLISTGLYVGGTRAYDAFAESYNSSNKTGEITAAQRPKVTVKPSPASQDIEHKVINYDKPVTNDYGGVASSSPLARVLPSATHSSLEKKLEAVNVKDLSSALPLDYKVAIDGSSQSTIHGIYFYKDGQDPRSAGPVLDTQGKYNITKIPVLTQDRKYLILQEDKGGKSSVNIALIVSQGDDYVLKEGRSFDGTLLKVDDQFVYVLKNVKDVVVYKYPIAAPTKK